MYSFETRTEKGVRALSTALTICIVAAVLSTISSLAALAIVGELTGGVTSGLLASAIGVLALLCGVFALYLVVIVFAIIGFSGVYKGKMEYGPAHEKDMSRAMILFVAAIVFFFASGAISFIGGFATGLGAGTSGTPFADSAAFLAVSEVFTILFSVAVALILYYVIRAFIPPERAGLALFAVVAYVLSSVLSYILSLVFFPSTEFLNHPTTVAFDPVWFLPGIVAGVITTVALLIFLILYRDTVARLKSRQYPPSFYSPAAQPQFQDQQLRWQPPPSP